MGPRDNQCRVSYWAFNDNLGAHRGPRAGVRRGTGGEPLIPASQKHPCIPQCAKPWGGPAQTLKTIYKKLHFSGPFFFHPTRPRGSEMLFWAPNGGQNASLSVCHAFAHPHTSKSSSFEAFSCFYGTFIGPQSPGTLEPSSCTFPAVPPRWCANTRGVSVSPSPHRGGIAIARSPHAGVVFLVLLRRPPAWLFFWNIYWTAEPRDP